jgi:hypothetical protein
MRGLVDFLKGLVTLLVMPLLPAAYRKRWPWHPLLPDAVTRWVVSLLHVVLSFLIWGFVFAKYQQEFGDRVAQAMWDSSHINDDPEVFKFLGWTGILGFFSFPFTPSGALTWTYLLDSVVRFVGMAMHSEHHATIFLAAPLWIYEQGRLFYERQRMNAIYGRATEPDRLFEIGDRICIRSTRPHLEWHAQLTFNYRGNLFRLVSGLEVEEGPRRCLEYRFEPWPEQQIIRRIVVLAGAERSLQENAP